MILGHLPSDPALSRVFVLDDIQSSLLTSTILGLIPGCYYQVNYSAVNELR